MVSVKLNTVVIPAATGLGLKLLVMVGAAGLVTVKFCGVTPFTKPPKRLLIFAVVLLRVPAAPTLTVNVMVHIAPAATVMVEAVKGAVPFAAVYVGTPQLTLVGTGGFAMVNGAVNVSLN